MASSSPVSQRFEYLAVGNEDGDILASWCVDDGENERKMALFARKLCRKSERMTHDRLLGPLNDTFYCMLSADSGRVPLVCVLSSSSKTLEKELVLRALRTGFAKEVSDDQVKEAHPGSLQESCAPLFDRLLKEYGVDKFAKVEKKVKAIKEIMNENIEIQLDNVRDIEELEIGAKENAKAAKELLDTAESVKWTMWFRKWKWGFITCCTLIIIVAVIGALMACSNDAC